MFAEGWRFRDGGSGGEEVCGILVGKFKKLKKTKEELTKYCMSKAFKFVSEQGRGDKSGKGLETSMQRYFAD